LVLICTEDDQVLLLERADIPGFWQSVTGSLEANETTSDAAARELFEETGLVACPTDCQQSVQFPIHEAWASRFAPGVTHNTEHWFLYRLPTSVAVSLQPDEHTRYEWLSTADALVRCSSESNRAAIQQFAA